MRQTNCTTCGRWKRTDPIPKSAIIWRGRSGFDGAPVVAIVTGMHGNGKNPKTGKGMAQLWILRSDMNPLHALETGSDSSICNGCGHRADPTGLGKKNTCYVSVGRAPQRIWKSFHAGDYPTMRPADVSVHLASRGMSIRLGAYGDPAALPPNVLADITHGIPHTGYTHSWRGRPELSPWLMASVDSTDELADARTQGWRTFRVRTPDAALETAEIACPASVEAGKRTTCDRCTLCDGARPDDLRRSIAIMAHGSGASTFISLNSLSA